MLVSMSGKLALMKVWGYKYTSHLYDLNLYDLVPVLRKNVLLFS